LGRHQANNILVVIHENIEDIKHTNHTKAMKILPILPYSIYGYWARVGGIFQDQKELTKELLIYISYLAQNLLEKASVINRQKKRRIRIERLYT
jgi:hypothetical protein